MKNIKKIVFAVAIMLASTMFVDNRIFAEIGLQIVHEKDVSIDKSWDVRFSKKFNPETINSNNIKMYDDGGQEVKISFEVVDDRVIRIAPEYSYKPDSEYSIKFNGITDTSGEGMEKPMSFEFKTVELQLDESKEMIGWEMAKFKDSYNYIIEDLDNIINEKSDNNIIKSLSPSTLYFEYNEEKIAGLKVVKNKKYLNKLQENMYENIPMVHVVYDSSVNKSEREFQKSVLEFFNNESLEDDFINRMIEEIKNQGGNRVILDFEGLDQNNKDGFTEFIGKIKDIDESMEVMVCVAYPNDNYLFNFIDVDNTKENVDAYIFMAYNQRGIGDRIPGPLASNRWVKSGIDKLMELGIETEKIILGVPTYNIDFATVSVEPELDSVLVVNRFSNGEEAAVYSDNTNKESILKTLTYGDVFTTEDYRDGWYKVRYEDGSGYIQKQFVQWIPKGKNTVAVGWDILTQSRTAEVIEENKGEIYYDEMQGQNVLTYYKFDRAETVKLEHKIWLEDETALQWKFKMVEEYGLKGIAIWRLGYEKENLFNK